MSTLYDLFKVKEDASQEEIKQAYEKIMKKADSLPEKSDKVIEQVGKIKIAYGILSNPEKRKQYDLDLATKRADELLENVVVKEKSEQEEQVQQPEPEIQTNRENRKVSVRELKEQADRKRREKQLQEQEQLKQQKKQDKKEKRKAKKEERLRKEMEIQAYGSYLEKQGYRVKYPWTWLRIKRLLISIISVVIALVIIYQIPFVKQTLKQLYEENFIVHALVDFVVSLGKSIVEVITEIFK